MSSFDDADTEETLTSLCIKVYHPLQTNKPIFQQIRFNTRQKHQTDDVLKFGRDSKSCHFVFLDPRASRIQFTLQVFRPFNSTELCFEVKNVSRKIKLIVGNTELDFLNKLTLPCKCLIRFGDFQFLIEKEGGESLLHFETFFELVRAPLLQEVPIVPSLSPIPETGVLNTGSSLLSYSSCHAPVEIDEDEPTYNIF